MDGLRKLTIAVFAVSAVLLPLEASDRETRLIPVRAEMLTRFPKYVEWPKARFAKDDSPFVIGVVGDQPLYDAVVAAAKQQKGVGKHPFSVQFFDPPKDHVDPKWKDCHLLYVAQSAKIDTKKLSEFAKKHHVLTVSDADKFVQNGGCMEFVIVRRKLRFRASAETAKDSELKLSSNLLRMAVKDE